MILAGAGIMLTFAARPKNWHLLVPAFILMGLGTVMAMAEEGFFDRWEVIDWIRTWWPVGLILFGLAMLLNRFPSSHTNAYK